jgi:hypothetical protein
MRVRFWSEVGLGGLSVALAVVTLVWPDWIELVFGIDPDEGSGTAEWLITGVCTVAAIISFALARIEWRRAQAVGATSGG